VSANSAPTLTQVYGFEGLTTGLTIQGKDGWVSNEPTLAMVTTTTTSGDYLGSKAFSVTQGLGGNFNREISHLASPSLAMPTLTQGATLTVEYDFTPSWWGSSFHVGADLNNNGNILAAGAWSGTPLDPSESAIGAGYSQYGGGAVSLTDAIGGAYNAVIGNLSGWERFRITLDTGANGGQGALSLSYRNLTDTGVWTEVQGLQGINAHLVWTGNTAANALLWNGLLFHAEADPASLDNIVYSVSGASVLPTAPPHLASIVEDVSSAANTGTLVSSLLSGYAADADSGTALGVAITGADTAHGSWQYSLDCGTTWLAMGSPAATAARVLDATAKLRFLPDADYNGTATLSFRAWDYSDGAATGSTVNLSTANAIAMAGAYSAQTDLASVTVAAVDDSPIILGLAVRNQALAMSGGIGAATGFLTPGLFAAGAATLECDVRVDMLTLSQEFIHLASTNPPGNHLILGVDTTGHVYVDNGFYHVVTGVTLSTDTWHHVGMTSSTSGAWATMGIVVDGVQVDSWSTAVPALSTLDMIVIGSAGNNAVPGTLDGLIDNVRVWNTAHTVAELVSGAGAPHTGTEPGLVGAWSFDPVNGNALSDLTGRHPLTLSGIANLMSPPAEAMHFAGTGQVVSGNTVAFADHTVEAWVRTTDTTAGHGIVSTSDTSGQTAQFYLAANGFLAVRLSTDGSNYRDWSTATWPVNDGQWHHVAYSYNATSATMNVFVDGMAIPASLITTGTPTAFSAVASHVVIGSTPDQAGDLVGDISDVRVWNVARTGWAVSEDMNHGLSGNEPGLVGNWVSAAGTVYDISGHDTVGPTVTDAFQSTDMLPASAATTLTTSEGVPLNGHVVLSDKDGGAPMVTTAVGGGPRSGTLLVEDDGTFAYIPNPGFYGSDSFTLQAGSSTKSFTVEVTDSTTVHGVTEPTGVLAVDGSGPAATARLNSSDFSANRASIEFDFSVPAVGTAVGVQRLLTLSGYNNTSLISASIDGSGTIAVALNGGAGTGFTNVSAGVWHHAAITFDGSQASLYLDGHWAASAVGGTANMLSTAAKLMLGPDTTATSMTAMFDNVKLWNSVLSTDQVSNYTQSGNSSGGNLVGHWTFNDIGSVSENLVGNSYTDMVVAGSGHIAEPPVRATHFTAGLVAEGSDSLVNTTTNGGQGVPAIAVQENGAHLVTWTDADTGGHVKAQLFHADGSKAGGELTLNTTGTQQNSSVVALANGNFMVTWSGHDGISWDVAGQIVDAAGAKLGSGFTINTNTAGEQSQPTTTELSNGNVVVSWQTYVPGSPYAIRAQILSPAGAKVGNEFAVNTNITGDHTVASVAALHNGGFVVVYNDGGQNPGDTFSGAVRGQMFDSSGAVAGSEFLVNTTVTGDQRVAGNRAVATLADG
ncbi:MAG: LamG domain-containing protein, partial [Magnetospirillum sp.]